MKGIAVIVAKKMNPVGWVQILAKAIELAFYLYSQERQESISSLFYLWVK